MIESINDLSIKGSNPVLDPKRIDFKYLKYKILISWLESTATAAHWFVDTYWTCVKPDHGWHSVKNECQTQCPSWLMRKRVQPSQHLKVPFFHVEFTWRQTLANNSTGCCYSKITRKSAFIQGQIPCPIAVRYLRIQLFEFTYPKSAFTICDSCLIELIKHAHTCLPSLEGKWS